MDKVISGDTRSDTPLKKRKGSGINCSNSGSHVLVEEIRSLCFKKGVCLLQKPGSFFPLVHLLSTTTKNLRTGDSTYSKPLNIPPTLPSALITAYSTVHILLPLNS